MTILAAFVFGVIVGAVCMAAYIAHSLPEDQEDDDDR